MHEIENIASDQNRLIFFYDSDMQYFHIEIITSAKWTLQEELVEMIGRDEVEYSSVLCDAR